ncbi:Fatty acid metabolism regulator protein [compost metagenome]
MRELFLKISEEKRLRIYKAAINEFAQNGYENASTHKIAKQAQISVGSLFQYFENKEDIFLSVAQYYASIVKEAFDEILHTDESFKAKLENVLRNVVKHSRENSELIKLYYEMSSPSNYSIMNQAAQKIETIAADFYLSLIEQGQAENVIPKGVDPKMVSYHLDNQIIMMQFSYSCGYYQERFRVYMGDDIFEQDDMVVKQVMKFLLAALCSESSSFE